MHYRVLDIKKTLWWNWKEFWTLNSFCNIFTGTKTTKLNDCLSLFNQGGVLSLNPPLAVKPLYQHAFPGPSRTHH